MALGLWHLRNRLITVLSRTNHSIRGSGVRVLVRPNTLLAQHSKVPVLEPNIGMVAGMGLVRDLLGVAASFGSETGESGWVLECCFSRLGINTPSFHPASEPGSFRGGTRSDPSRCRRRAHRRHTTGNNWRITVIPFTSE